MKSQFSEKEIIDLTMAIVTINSWNRISIAFRTTPGTTSSVSSRKRLKGFVPHVPLSHGVSHGGTDWDSTKAN